MSKEEWYYVGHYDSTLLCESFFDNYYNEKAFKEAHLPLIKGVSCRLNFDLYTLEADQARISNFFYSRMASGDLEPLFYFIEKAKQSGIIAGTSKYEFNSLDGFKAFVEDAKPMMAYWLAIIFADAGVERALKEKCDASKLDLSAVLSQSSHNELELIQKNRELARLCTLDKQGKITESDLAAFLERFGWTSTNSFMGLPMALEELLNEIQNFKPPVSNQINKLNLDWSELKIANDLAFLRLRFMEVLNKITFSFWPLLRKLGEQSGLSFEEVCAHTYNEILALRFSSKAEIVERIKKHGLLVEREGFERVLIGKELEIEIGKHSVETKNVLELLGLSACQGKAIGSAKVVLLMKEMYKVQKGDILIASETTPEYVPAMKMAGAIVTDMGGITSHAAIVSRELQVPCVIGTKFATKVFKDGDLIEVDAMKGTVRKLK